MQTLGSFDEAHAKVLRDTQRCLGVINRLSATECDSVEAGIAVLDQLRRETYEDLNQIQHEHLIISSAEWLALNLNLGGGLTWTWNPRQTGDNTEPDLRGTRNGAVVLSAEVTTSERPVGTIETRMKSTLTKLAAMDGLRYYFVRTSSMAQRATTKVSKAGWQITVVNLSA
jgi:hypothetical protein